jgi:hypothetical protein
MGMLCNLRRKLLKEAGLKKPVVTQRQTAGASCVQRLHVHGSNESITSLIVSLRWEADCRLGPRSMYRMPSRAD